MYIYYKYKEHYVVSKDDDAADSTPISNSGGWWPEARDIRYLHLLYSYPLAMTRNLSDLRSNLGPKQQRKSIR